MRKVIQIFSIILVTGILLPGLIYLGLAIYYRDSFMYGTWINGVYCTGKTVQEVEKELTEQFTYDGLTISGVTGVEFLPMEELDYTYNFASSLEEYRRNQNPLQWFVNMITGHQNTEILPQIVFQEEKLNQWLYQSGAYKANLNLSEDTANIVFTQDGYQLKEDKAKVLDVVQTKEKIMESLYAVQNTLDLEEAGCYFTREDTKSIQELRTLYEKVEKMQKLSLTYQLYEVEKKVTPYEISLWIATDKNGDIQLDKNGEVVIDTKAVTAFVNQLGKDYDTWRNTRFTTHDGKEIVLTKGNYGTRIDQKKEVNFLINFLKEREYPDTVRTPEYSKNTVFKDRNLIDQTYIEVDMTAQKMFYFAEGELKLETDVVTGCTSQRNGTPEVVCYIYNKSEDAILKGENYRSFVNYWVPVYGGIGIHDATWRTEFGGTIYKKNGSHGCINTPLEKMTELYEMVEVGTPVVLHY